MIEETRRIDETTGEIVNKKVRHIAVQFDEAKGYLFWARKSFAKSFLDVPFPGGLTHAELGKLAILSKHMWANTNMLGYRGNGGARPYTIVQIGGLVGLKEYQAGVFVRKLERKGVIARAKVETEGRSEIQFYVNPIYFFSSNRIPLNLYLIFREQLDKVLPAWVKEEFSRAKQAK